MSPLPRKNAAPPVDLKPARARGALLGLAIGDALGTTNEFKRLAAPPFPKLADGPVIEPIGGGPFRVKPGQVTDDTQMATCLAASLRGCDGFSAEDALGRYRAWQKHAFDIGNQTASALSSGLPADLCGKNVWLESGRSAAGNGSLMRTAPIGVFYSGNPAERTRASLEDSALTHFDPRCQLACAAFNGAIAFCLNAKTPPKPEAVLAATQSALTLAAATLAKGAREYIREVQDAAEVLKLDLSFAKKEDPEVYGPELKLFEMQGFVRVAFRLAFWELCHAPTLEAGLVDIANRGGDADTNAAITGALLGAFHGEEAIPARWRTTVLEALAESGSALATLYHPRQLLLLVD